MTAAAPSAKSGGLPPAAASPAAASTTPAATAAAALLGVTSLLRGSPDAPLAATSASRSSQQCRAKSTLASAREQPAGNAIMAEMSTRRSDSLQANC